MSDPSSWAMDDDSPVRATSASMCGRAISHRPSELTYAMPRLITFGVSPKVPPEDRTKPSSSRVSSRRRAVGRASPAAAATSLSDMPRWSAPNAARMSSPRASASTKSGPWPRPAMPPLFLAEQAAARAVRGLRLVLGVLVRVVEHLGRRQVWVHAGRPGLLAELGPQVADGGLDRAADRAEVGPDQPVLVLDHAPVHQHGVHV